MASTQKESQLKLSKFETDSEKDVSLLIPHLNFISNNFAKVDYYDSNIKSRMEHEFPSGEVKMPTEELQTAIPRDDIENENSNILEKLKELEKKVNEILVEPQLLQYKGKNNKIGACKRKAVKPNYSILYLDCCKNLNKIRPTLADLVSETRINQSQWFRVLNDIQDIYQFLKEVRKKVNYAKSDEMREFWINVEYDIYDKADKIKDKIYQSKNKLYDEEGVYDQF